MSSEGKDEDDEEYYDDGDDDAMHMALQLQEITGLFAFLMHFHKARTL